MLWIEIVSLLFQENTVTDRTTESSADHISSNTSVPSLDETIENEKSTKSNPLRQLIQRKTRKFHRQHKVSIEKELVTLQIVAFFFHKRDYILI